MRKVGGFGKKTARVLGPLAVIIFFLPTFAFASTVVGTGDTVYQNPGTRAFGTIYQNLTGSSMFVSVSAVNTTTFDQISCQLGIGSPPVTTVVIFHTSGAQYTNSGSFVVPSNWYYRCNQVNGATVSAWVEWYNSTTTVVSSSSGTTTATTTSIVYNPTESLFYGWVIFFSVLALTLWFFRPRVI